MSTATRSGDGQPAQHISRSDGVKRALTGLFELPVIALRTVVQSARTTPGRLSLIAIGLVALALLTALVGAFVVQDKKDTINGLIDHREPLAVAAQQVYRSLSDADATAASAFLSTGTEPPELRARYETNIAEAGAALAKSASDSASVSAAADQVNILSQQLPVYTGLVEIARANNRQGFPVGAAYLREASELMRAKLLPAAQELYRIDTERLVEEQDDANGFPWITTLLVIGLLAALVVTQVYLTRKTNRLVNIGLLVASVAVALIFLWGLVALTVQSVLVSGGRDDGSTQVDVLVQARIAALQARADETLTLVARGDGASYEKEFAAISVQLLGSDGNGGLLNEAKSLAERENSVEHIDSAINNAKAWLRAHNQVRNLDNGGDYTAAVTLAIDPNVAEGAASSFSRLDNDLATAITSHRQEFLTDTRNADRALVLLAPGLAVLAVVAAGGATIGIRERLREYR